MLLCEQPRIVHGGRLRQAAHDYRIPLQHWLDLSTGLAPAGWPVPQIPAEVWRRLPEEDDGLGMASLAYFGKVPVLPVAGSQAAIQALPQLLRPCRVGILSPCYAEHLRAWQMAGHDACEVYGKVDENTPDSYDILVLSNPNNPTGTVIAPAMLREWHQRLASRDGLLVVDEAFMDATPQASILGEAEQPGLVVLRSLGKFFGLAGLRCGFVAAETSLLQRLDNLLGPWAVSHPARWVTQRVLADRPWQQQQREWLLGAAQRLADLLDTAGLASPSGCALFRWVPTPQARTLADSLARRGILVRSFAEGLRFGLPHQEADWERLRTSLHEVLA